MRVNLAGNLGAPEGMRQSMVHRRKRFVAGLDELVCLDREVSRRVDQGSPKFSALPPTIESAICAECQQYSDGE